MYKTADISEFTKNAYILILILSLCQMIGAVLNPTDSVFQYIHMFIVFNATISH